MILALLLACADAELAPLKGARDDYTRGREALDAGRGAEAAEAFAAARKGDPTSAVLALWEARARAASGDLAAAEALATEVIQAHPDAGLAWYNRAAWRVKLGHPDAAAEDLRRAIGLGVASPYEAAIDPDFVPVLGTAPFAEVLPPSPAHVQVKGPDGAVFLGSDVVVEVMMFAAPSVEVLLRREGTTPGCLRLERIVEDQHTENGVTGRRLDLHFRAVAACSFDLQLGAEVTAPVRGPVEVGPVHLLVEAPSSFSAGPATELPSAFVVPGFAASADGAWAAGRVAEVVWALGRADETPNLDGAAPPIALELRVDGTTRAAGGAWPHADAGTVAAGEWSAPIAADR